MRALCENDPKLGFELMKRTAEVLVGRLQATRRQLVEKSRKTRDASS